MGNNTYMKVSGKGYIGIGEGTFNDVLCVPSLTTNLLSIYQITHGGQGKTIEFTLDRVYIRDLETRDIVAIGMLIIHLVYIPFHIFLQKMIMFLCLHHTLH